MQTSHGTNLTQTQDFFLFAARQRLSHLSVSMLYNILIKSLTFFLKCSFKNAQSKSESIHKHRAGNPVHKTTAVMETAAPSSSLSSFVLINFCVVHTNLSFLIPTWHCAPALG